MSNQPQIAVAGAGYWGKNLIRNFHSLGSLAAICDRDEALLASYRDKYPQARTCLKFSDIFDDPDIAGVVIATPAEKHYAQAREALLAGRHVFVEKPLVLDEEEALELIELADARRLVLMVGHLLQYHPAFIEIKRLSMAGELGRINYICSHRLNLGKVRREENILWSFAPHDISMILSLAGAEPESVMAAGANYLHRQIADVTTTHLEFASGLKAHIFVSWLHPFKEQKLVVVGDQKMAVFDDTKPWPDKLLLYPHQIHWENNTPIPHKGEVTRVELPESEPLLMECGHFLECVSQGKTPRTDGREGLAVLKVLNASQKSLDGNGKRIILAEKKKDEERFPGVFIHETALVDRKVDIGPGTKIWHYSHVMSGAVVGRNVNMGQNVHIGPDVRIGDGCKIQNNVSIYTGVTLEDEVFCGPSMVFTNVFNPRAAIRRMGELRPTRVGRGATLGANCTIVCGNDIGRYALVGAGAVVTSSVPAHALVIGNPARFAGWMCECGVKLADNRCPECGREYDFPRKPQPEGPKVFKEKL